MKKIILTICLVLIILTSGCVGSNPKPIAKHQSGDKYLNCLGLKFEIQNIDKQIEVRKELKKAKGFGNLIKLAGISLIAPGLFIDLKNAEQIEIDALEKRKKVLLEIEKRNERYTY